jgi:hypothetical protein
MEVACNGDEDEESVSLCVTVGYVRESSKPFTILISAKAVTGGPPFSRIVYVLFTVYILYRGPNLIYYHFFFCLVCALSVR